MNKKLILGFVIVVVIGWLSVITFLLAEQREQLIELKQQLIELKERPPVGEQDLRHIVTFEQCAEAEGIILDLDPRSCTTEDGVTFTDWQGVGKFCIQVITPAKNSQTGEIREFPTPCDVPRGWIPLQ